MRVRQQSQIASSQQSTQELAGLVQQCCEQARRLRAMIKGLLGTKNERLVQFNVAPIRSRKSKAQPPVAPPPPTTESPVGGKPAA
jgi:hypothetical protein